MFQKKMILKSGSEIDFCTVTAKERIEIRVKKELHVLAATVNGAIAECENGTWKAPLSAPIREIAVLAEKSEKYFFGAIGCANEALTRWKLIESAENARKNAEEEALIEEKGEIESAEKERSAVEEVATEKEKETEDLSERFGINEVQETKTESRKDKAKKLIESGEPITLFEDVLPSTRWAKIQTDEGAYYLGVSENEEEEKVYYGVDGVRDLPPEGNWAFYPTCEDENTGVFVSEGE